MRCTVPFLAAAIAALLVASCSTKEGPVEYRVDSNGSTIQGSIDGALTTSKSPYYVAGTITVDSGKTLVIPAGVILRFTDSAAFVIKGSVQIEGEADNRVTLTASDSAWRGVIVMDAQAGSAFRFADIEMIDATSSRDSMRNGAVEIVRTDFTLRDCEIRNCRAVNGGGLYLENARCLVENNIIAGNFAGNFGGGICSNHSGGRFLNNTICSNRAWNFGGGILLASSEQTEVQNNIFYANTEHASLSHVKYYQCDSTRILLAYNFFGSETADPKFVDELSYRLASASPCINAGNPAAEFSDPDGSRNDQGAYGGPFALPRPTNKTMASKRSSR